MCFVGRVGGWVGRRRSRRRDRREEGGSGREGEGAFFTRRAEIDDIRPGFGPAFLQSILGKREIGCSKTHEKRRATSQRSRSWAMTLYLRLHLYNVYLPYIFVCFLFFIFQMVMT